MKKLDDIVRTHTSSGFTLIQARNKAAQEVILSKIEKSEYVDKILLKGGIVMYNMTQERRRTTSDLDFDFIRLDISKKQIINKFIQALNRIEPQFQIELKSVKPLKQDDYKGCELKLVINDNAGSRPIDFTMDIGVHTLTGIEQNKMCFSFGETKQLSLWVNPPEQMFAEKLYSLAKIGPTSTRYKDINDMYYLIKHTNMKISLVRECLSLMIIGNKRDFIDVIDIVDKAIESLDSDLFAYGFNEAKSLWLDIGYQELIETVKDYIYKI